MTSARAIGEIVRDGIDFDVKNWGGVQMADRNLLDIADSLFALLESREIPYLLVGGIAMLSYTEGRNTQDIDFIFSRKDFDRFPELTLNEENRDFARGEFCSLQIDCLLTGKKLFKKVLAKFGTRRQFGNLDIACATVEGLILRKSYALPSLYRQGQMGRASLYEGDITQLLLAYRVDLPPLLKELAKHLLPSDLDEVRDVLDEIQGRVARMKRRAQRDRAEDAD
ncbi:MAG: hypothetical protein ACFB9N_06290 [Geitlerinemataceae cyanobacterium]